MGQLNSMKIISKTKVQLIQKLVYDLFQQIILKSEGVILPGEEGLPEEFIAKSVIVDKLIIFLNTLGDELEKDIDLQEVLNAINIEENEPLSEEGKEDSKLLPEAEN